MPSTSTTSRRPGSRKGRLLGHAHKKPRQRRRWLPGLLSPQTPSHRHARPDFRRRHAPVLSYILHNQAAPKHTSFRHRSREALASAAVVAGAACGVLFPGGHSCQPEPAAVGHAPGLCRLPPAAGHHSRGRVQPCQAKHLCPVTSCSPICLAIPLPGTLLRFVKSTSTLLKMSLHAH